MFKQSPSQVRSLPRVPSGCGKSEAKPEAERACPTLGARILEHMRRKKMVEAATKSNGSNSASVTAKFDAVVVGAGVAGLYQL